MALLALPQELKDEILSIYVLNEFSYKVVETRLVCREFDNIISQQLIRKAVQISLEENEVRYGDQAYIRYHFAAILSFRILRRGEENCKYLQCFRYVIDAAVKEVLLLNGGSSQGLRLQYARDISKAIADNRLPRGPMPAVSELLARPFKFLETSPLRYLRILAAAIVGNTRILLETITSVGDVQQWPGVRLPSALEAAVTVNQIDTVKCIVKWTLKMVRGPSQTGNWREMRSSAESLCSALCLAISHHQDSSTEAIFGALSQPGPMGESLLLGGAETLLFQSVKYANARILCETVHYMRYRKWGSYGELTELEHSTIEEIFEACSPEFLYELILDGMFNVDNACVGHSPLWYALKFHRQDLAIVLLEQGASVNRMTLHEGCAEFAAKNIFQFGRVEFLDRMIRESKFSVNNIGLSYTPLWLALEVGRRDLAIWLLENGAEVNGYSNHRGRRVTVV
ncbi:hypothetical protein E8E13_007881 [Curvularia kusanoi]|uniref:Uncharacterized protein n=1 Tax=Curvularia kusanoi TaxID=90978 RepID=A0A9P4TIM1_CURKU|nr:hypothetical protein E8E13_007881 [Curvularia kusanoi]